MTHSRQHQQVYLMFWLISSLCESHAVAVQEDGHGNAITNIMAPLIRRQINKRAKSQLKAGDKVGEVSADGKVKVDAMLKATAESAQAEVDADANFQFIAQAEKGNEGAARRRRSRRRCSRRRQGISPKQTWKSLIQEVTKTACCDQSVQDKASAITRDGPEIQITYDRRRCQGAQNHRRRHQNSDEIYTCVPKQAIAWAGRRRRREAAPAWISQEANGLNPVCDSIGYVDGDNKLFACLHPSIDTDEGFLQNDTDAPNRLELSRQTVNPDPGNHKLCFCIDEVLSVWSGNIGFDEIKSKICGCQGLCEDFKTEELKCDPSPQCNPQSGSFAQQGMRRASLKENEVVNATRSSLDSTTQSKCA
jgi:hypothetical protein